MEIAEDQVNIYFIEHKKTKLEIYSANDDVFPSKTGVGGNKLLTKDTKNKLFVFMHELDQCTPCVNSYV